MFFANVSAISHLFFGFINNIFYVTSHPCVLFNFGFNAKNSYSHMSIEEATSIKKTLFFSPSFDVGLL